MGGEACKREANVWQEGRGTLMSSQMILVDWDIRSLEKCGVRDALSAPLLRVTSRSEGLLAAKDAAPRARAFGGGLSAA